jgi:biopolymer transport protein ExbD
MVEMNVPERSSKGRGRAQKRNTRVDLTAMVDLGFLLITFFMLASVFQKPKAMELNKPAPLLEEPVVEESIKETKTFTIIAGKNDKLYCYTGADDDLAAKIDTLNFSRQALREKVLQRKDEVTKQWGNSDFLVVFIKFYPKSKYRNMVDILDEMAICGVRRYAIVDKLNETDQRLALHTGNQD